MMGSCSSHYGSASVASLLENTHLVEAMYSEHAGLTTPGVGNSSRGLVKEGGDSRRRFRMCETKGCWVADPCEMRVRRADRRRTGGTDRPHCQTVIFRQSICNAENSQLEMRTSSIMFLPRH